jgi:hypothetical protein
MECLSEAGPQRERLVANGRRRARQFSWRATAAKHHDLLERMSGLAAAPSPASSPAERKVLHAR